MLIGYARRVIAKFREAGGPSRDFYVHCAVFLVFVCLFFVRAFRDDLKRPFMMDELLTVRYYTWVGVSSTGEDLPIHNIADFYSQPRPGLQRLAIGTYCSTGRWPEPNNHILNSALVNFSLALGQRSEFWTRLPALIGAACFAWACYYLCGSVLQWRVAAPLVLLWSWFCPYIFEFSQTARGYSWLPALQVLLLIAAYRLASAPRSVTRGVLCTALACITLLNIVSMTVDWLVPAYAALFLSKPRDLQSDHAEDESWAWRRNLLCQVLVIITVGLVFLVCHAPSVFSASRQYGLKFSGLGDFLGSIGDIYSYHFNNFGWILFSAFSVVGVLLLCVTQRKSFVTKLIVLVPVVSFAHYLLSGRFPYLRTTGHLVPIIMLSAAFTVEKSAAALDRWQEKVAVFCGYLMLTVGLILPSFWQSLESPKLAYWIEETKDQQIPFRESCPTYVILQDNSDYIYFTYAPKEWNCLEIISPRRISLGQRLRVCMLRRDASADDDLGSFELTRFVGDVVPLNEEFSGEPDAFVFWYPDVTRLGVAGERQNDYVNRFRQKCLGHQVRYVMKLNVTSNLEAFVFLASSQQQYAEVRKIVQGGMSQFGGKAVVFVPERKRVLRRWGF